MTNPASADRTLRKPFAPKDGQTMGIYFDGNETVRLLQPALSLFLCTGQTAPSLDDTSLLIQARCD